MADKHAGLTPVPTQIGFEEKYTDDSGVEFGVYWDIHRDRYALKITQGGDEVFYPSDRLDWLLGCLLKIAAEVPK